MARIVKTDDMEWKQHALVPSVSVKIVTGKNTTVQLVKLEKGATMDPHSHVEEQLGYVIEGSLEFAVGPNCEIYIAEAGSFFFFESNEVHELRNTLEKAVVLDVFGPARKDYLHLAVRMNS